MGCQIRPRDRERCHPAVPKATRNTIPTVVLMRSLPFSFPSLFLRFCTLRSYFVDDLLFSLFFCFLIFCNFFILRHRLHVTVPGNPLIDTSARTPARRRTIRESVLSSRKGFQDAGEMTSPRISSISDSCSDCQNACDIVDNRPAPTTVGTPIPMTGAPSTLLI